MQFFKDLFQTIPIIIMIEEDFNIDDIIISYHNSKLIGAKKIVSVVFAFVNTKLCFQSSNNAV